LKKFEKVNVTQDLDQYLRNKHALIAPEFSEVVADATAFIEDVLRNGFEAACSRLGEHVNVQPDRPFIEVAEVLVEYHIRFVRETDSELSRKSLLEAYTHVAGLQYVFEPTKKTRFVRTLRRSEPRKFAGLVLSLHLYNVISAYMHNELRRRIPDAKALELYLLNLEAICQQLITEAMKTQRATSDKAWAIAVIREVETKLLRPGVVPIKSFGFSLPTRVRN